MVKPVKPKNPVIKKLPKAPPAPPPRPPPHKPTRIPIINPVSENESSGSSSSSGSGASVTVSTTSLANTIISESVSRAPLPNELAAALQEANQIKLRETVDEDIHTLFSSLDRNQQALSYLHYGQKDPVFMKLRSRLNENIFTIMTNRKNKKSSIWNPTEEKPFVNPQSTGIEVIDAFISQRIASLATEEDKKKEMEAGDRFMDKENEDEDDEDEKEGYIFTIT